MPPSYSSRSGGTGRDTPRSPPQYSGSNDGYGTNGGPQQQYGRGADGSAGYGALFVQQYGSGSHSYRAKPFVRHYSGGDGTAMWPQHQQGPRPFCSFAWEQRGAYGSGPSVNGGLTNSIAQGQAQRDVGVDDQEGGQQPSMEVDCHGGTLSEVFGPPESEEQQRTTTEMDCHDGPVSEVSGSPEATVSLAREGLPLQARHQRRLQPPSGTPSPPTAVISDSAFEEWLQSDETELLLFSLSEGQRQQPPKHTISTAEGPQQSAPTAVALAAAAPTAAAVTGTRVFPAVSSKGVAEAPASSAGAASVAVPAAAPATSGTVPSAASVEGAPASSAVAAATAEISAAKPATSGTSPSAASIRGAVGGRESSAGALPSDAAEEAAPSIRGTVSPLALAARAARAPVSAAGSAGDSWAGNICGKRGASTHPFDPGTVFPLDVRYSSDERARHNGGNSRSGCSSSSSSNRKPANTTHGEMQPVLGHCCDPLIRGSNAGGV